MPEILFTLKQRVASVRQHLRENRPQLIAEALELLDIGLTQDEVYLELRDRYLDSIPVIAEAADDAVNWSAVLPGAAGDILEAIDGKVVDTLLRLVVAAADRRRQRKQRGGVLLGDLLRRTKAAPRDITPTAKAVDEAVVDEDKPARSGGLSGWTDGMNSPI